MTFWRFDFLLFGAHRKIRRFILSLTGSYYMLPEHTYKNQITGNTIELFLILT